MVGDTDILSTIANGGIEINPTMSLAVIGFSSGIPTRTTATLTPTTLRCLEQTFLEYQNLASQPEQHDHQAGFVPPVVSISSTTSVANISHNQTNMSNADHIQQPMDHWYVEPSSSSAGHPATRRPEQYTLLSLPNKGASVIQNNIQGTRVRGTGGRRSVKDERLSPEEEERRKQRRERNKQAAARCRKKRMDQTNNLQEETDGLESTKQSLRQEISSLQEQREKLEFILDAHRRVCKLRGSTSMPENRSQPTIRMPYLSIKQEEQLSSYSGGSSTSDSETDNSQPATSIQVNSHVPAISRSVVATQPSSVSDRLISRPPATSRPVVTTEPTPSTSSRLVVRPNTLPISFMFSSSPSLKMTSAATGSATEATGVPIQTPSKGMFNFEALMEGGTGLTPISSGQTPSCSGQQISNSDSLSTPDVPIPPKFTSRS